MVRTTPPRPRDLTTEFPELAALARPAVRLSVSPGCKAGGHAPWGYTEPCPVACSACGAETAPLLTLDDFEWDSGSFSWRPIEDAGDDLVSWRAASSTELQIARGMRMQFYVCTESSAHPVLRNTQ